MKDSVKLRQAGKVESLEHLKIQVQDFLRYGERGGGVHETRKLRNSGLL
ncbi:MAG: hypothetical protein ACOCSC_00085 [Candidatus Hadarchaeota archaeon]